MVALLYYALRILTTFRKGMLEKGWKFIAQGIIVLVAGQFITTVSYSFPVGGYLYQIGTGVDALGVVFILLGAKIHLDVWSVGKNDSRKSETRAMISQNENT